MQASIAKSFLRGRNYKSRALHSVPQYSFQHVNDPIGLNEEQVSIQKTALDFAVKNLVPNAGEWDRKHYFPIDTYREAAKLGFASVYTQPDFGGCGLGRLEASTIFEALAYGCPSFSAYLTVHNMVCWIIDTFGTHAQKEKFVPKLSTMEMLGAYCLTEPNTGSDSAAMQTSAKKVGGDYVINGAKCFISGGSVSDVLVVMCRTGPKDISAILVEKGTPGLSFGKKEEKMGWNNQPTVMVMFEDVKVPQCNLLDKEGNGFKVAMKGLDGGRINIASCSLGGAAFALDQAFEYSKTRKQFGKPISEFQYLQFKMADMATDLVSSRLMVRNAAKMVDEDNPQKTIYSAMAKRYATDKCFDIVNYALQIHGGYGYLKEYPIEKIFRDLRVHQILEGTNEIMRLIISKRLLKDQ